jgi:hypothetical protein
MNPKHRAVAWRTSSNLATRLPQWEKHRFRVGDRHQIAHYRIFLGFQGDRLPRFNPQLGSGGLIKPFLFRSLHCHVAHSLRQLRAIHSPSNSPPHRKRLSEKLPETS